MYTIYLFISHHSLWTTCNFPGWSWLVRSCVHGRLKGPPKDASQNRRQALDGSSSCRSNAEEVSGEVSQVQRLRSAAACCSRVFLGYINYLLNQYMTFHFFKLLLQSQSSLGSQMGSPWILAFYRHAVDSVHQHRRRLSAGGISSA